MERPGERLKRVREKLGLTYRDVEQASRQIAERRGSEEFIIALSRLADIENKGTAPSIHRLYTLCAAYRLDYEEVLRWYGVPRELLESEAVQVGLRHTHVIQFTQTAHATVPRMEDCEIDLRKTTFLSHVVQQWGRLPLTFLNGLDLRPYCYGFIGTDDWFMYPVLRPGSLVAIDQSKRKIVAGGWANELERPIYFLEHRGGYLCGWCSTMGEQLLVQPHPASHQAPVIFEFDAGVDILGQVIAAAMILESRKHQSLRPGAKVRD